MIRDAVNSGNLFRLKDKLFEEKGKYYIRVLPNGYHSKDWISIYRPTILIGNIISRQIFLATKEHTRESYDR